MSGSLLGDLTVSFKVDLSSLSSGISQAKSEMSGVGDVASSASSSVSSGFMGAIGSVVSFGAQIGQTIFGLQQLAGGAVSLAQSLLQPAATAETTQLSFTTLLHSTTAAHQEMVALNTFAASTPMQTQWVDNAAAKILAFGGKVGDVKPEITAIGDSLSGLGKLSETSLNSIVDIFGKISAQGKLTGGDMMQLSTWGIPAWQALSDAMGKPIPVLQKMVSSGLIPASIAIPALEKGMEKTFGGGMAKQANTFTGIVSTLASNWQIAMAAFGSPLLQLAEQGLGQIGNILSSSAFQDFAGSVGQKIADVFSRISGTIGGLISGGSGLLTFFQEIARGWQNIFVDADGNSSLPGIEAAFAGAKQAALNFVNTVGPLVGPMLSEFNSLLTTLAGWITQLVAPALDMMAERTNALTAFLKPIISTVIPLTISLENLVNAIMPVVVGIASWISQNDILTPIMAGLGSVLGGLITSLTSLINFLAQVAFFFEQNQAAAQILGDVLVGIGAAIAAIQIGAFIATIPALVAGFIAWATTAGAAAIATVAAALPIVAIGAAIALVVVGIILAVQHWGAISAWLVGAWSGVSSFFAGIWKNIQGFFGGIGQWFHDRFQQASDGVKSAWSGVTGFIGGIGESIHNGISGALTATKNDVSSIGQGIQQGWQDTVDGIVNAGKWLYDHNTYVKQAVDFNVQVFNYAKQQAVAIWTNITSWISNEWALISNYAKVYWTLIYVSIEEWILKAQQFITNIWNTVAGFVGTVWHVISAYATVYWTLIYVTIESWILKIQQSVTSIWTTVSTWLQTQWNNLASFATTAWRNVSTIFANIWTTYIGTPMNNFLNSWNKFWSGIVTNALNVGKNIMTAIANGITGAVGAVGNAIHGAISSALSGLGFHGIPGFASGVTNYAGGWAMVGEKGPELMYVPQGASVYPQSSLPSSSPLQGSSTGGEQTIHVYLDGSVITTVVANRMMRQVRVRTGLKV